MGSYSFSKREKLCSQKTIDRLFKEGSSVKSYPLRAVFLEVDKAEAPVQVLISVPKKRVRKAHDRNRVKRLIREAYRLNKNVFLDNLLLQDSNLALGFIFLSDSKIDFQEISKSMSVTLMEIANMYTPR
jgi:ribonuclease P protein component